MKKAPSESARINPRVIAALISFSVAGLLAFVSLAATPASGTLSPGGAPVTWSGFAAAPPLGAAAPDPASCVNGVNCDTFTLTLSGTPADWAGKKARVKVNASVDGDDVDVFIYKGTSSGPLGTVVGSSASSGGAEEVTLDPAQQSIGTGDFTVQVVYFLVSAGGTYNAEAASITTPVDPGPGPGASPTPTAAPIPPGTPRFVNHYAPPGVLEDAGEPTMGVNWNTENVSRPKDVPGAQTFRSRNRATGAENPVIGNGGTSLYYGGINSIFLRANFDDCSSPAGVDWGQIPLLTANTTRVFYDPILYTDHWTGRTFVGQEAGLTPAGSTLEFTDNDGDAMFQSEGAAPSGGIDHQTIGGGPFHAPTPPTVLTPKIPTSGDGTPVPDPGATPYPHGVYYASQSIGTATNETSLDGGFTFPVQSPLFFVTDCVGLHGHIKAAEDGTLFIPDKACQPAGVPILNDGLVSVIVSENNGATWAVRQIPGARGSGGQDDPSVGVSWCPPGTCTPEEKTRRSNNIYMGFLYSDDPATPDIDETNRPGVSRSTDKGLTWSTPIDLSTISEVKHAAFPTMAVGDPERAAFAFLGTPDAEKPGEDHTGGANDDTTLFSGAWYLYVATTFDGGATWTVQRISPEGPIQRGPICGGGTCRNLLDFQDIQIDKQGRVLIAGQDGCIGGCELGGPNSYTAKAFISRQSGGKRMFAVNDPQTVEPALPGAPLLTGSFDGSKVTLSWAAPDNGGSPITQYRVYRAETANGPFPDPPLATLTQPGYVDTAPPAGNKFYVVTAVNAVGEGPFCKAFAPPSGPIETPCVLPGRLISNDLLPNGSDNDTGANVSPDPRTNIKTLHIAEPFVPDSEQLFFTLQVQPSTAGAPPPNSQYFIIWQRQAPDTDFDRAYVAMKTGPTGEPTFEYGKLGVPTAVPPDNPNTNTPVRIGDADNGSYDVATGVIQIALSKNKLREFDGGAGKYQPGSDLSATEPRTYFNRADVGIRTQSTATDFGPTGSYAMVGNTACTLPVGVPATFLNISTRATVQTGDRVSIGGFIISGNAPKRVVIRAIGPSLGARGVSNALQDPVLTLNDSNSAVLAENDNWRDSPDQTAIQVSTLAPTDDRESAIIRTLDPGAYTAVVSGKNGSQGVGLVEIYDIDGLTDPRLGNLSTRAFVGENDDVLIGGFIASTSSGGPADGVLRALGPSLAARGVSGGIQDPTIELFDANGNPTDFNDNWKDSDGRNRIESSGFAPSDDREAVLFGSFPPGLYTAIVRAKGGETGVGLVEIYNPR